MLESKELGIVITEDDEETGWFNLSESLENEIKMLNLRKERAKNDKKTPDRQITQKFRRGCDQMIKQCNQQLTINKQLLEFAKTKIKRKA